MSGLFVTTLNVLIQRTRDELTLIHHARLSTLEAEWENYRSVVRCFLLYKSVLNLGIEKSAPDMMSERRVQALSIVVDLFGNSHSAQKSLGHHRG